MDLLLRFMGNKYVLGGLLVLVVLAVVYLSGVHSGASSVQADWDKEKLDTANQLIAVTAKNTVLVNNARNQVKENERDLQNAIQDTEAVVVATIDGLRTDNIRLRQQFTGCRTTLSAARKASPDPGTSDSGLSEADAAVAVRIAGDADIVAKKYNASLDHIGVLENLLRECNGG